MLGGLQAGAHANRNRRDVQSIQEGEKEEERRASDDEAETSADESRAEPGTGEPEQTASAAEGTLGRGTRRAATSTDYGGPVPRRQTTQGRRR